MTIKLTKEQKSKANKKAKREADIFFNLNNRVRSVAYKNKKVYDRKREKTFDI